MINFAHITPTKFLPIFGSNRPFHLVLAHLVETDEKYADFYLKESCNKDTTIILDNSAFEMYKQGRDMYPSDKLIEMGVRCGADYIVMSDYPGQPAQVTIDAAIEMAPRFRDADFGTFFVPQSEIGDLDDLCYGFDWAANSELVDYIGVSILGVPNAYGVEKDNKLQRFLSRWKFMELLGDEKVLKRAKFNEKKIHFLGMVDGPNEILLLRKYLKYINTWDSSAAVWAGLNGIPFDSSPTGLIDGKYEKEVDFDYEIVDTNRLGLAMSNCRYIDNLIYQEWMKGWDEK